MTRCGKRETGVVSGMDGQALTGGTKGVGRRELPHARHELREATNEEGHADYDVGVENSPRVDIVHGKDESGRGEAIETTEERGITRQKLAQGGRECDGTHRGPGLPSLR